MRELIIVAILSSLWSANAHPRQETPSPYRSGDINTAQLEELVNGFGIGAADGRLHLSGRVVTSCLPEIEFIGKYENKRFELGIIGESALDCTKKALGAMTWSEFCGKRLSSGGHQERCSYLDLIKSFSMEIPKDPNLNAEVFLGYLKNPTSKSEQIKFQPIESNGDTYTIIGRHVEIRAKFQDHLNNFSSCPTPDKENEVTSFIELLEPIDQALKQEFSGTLSIAKSAAEEELKRKALADAELEFAELIKNANDPGLSKKSLEHLEALWDQVQEAIASNPSLVNKAKIEPKVRKAYIEALANHISTKADPSTDGLAAATEKLTQLETLVDQDEKFIKTMTAAIKKYADKIIAKMSKTKDEDSVDEYATAALDILGKMPESDAKDKQIASVDTKAHSRKWGILDSIVNGVKATSDSLMDVVARVGTLIENSADLEDSETFEKRGKKLLKSIYARFMNGAERSAGREDGLEKAEAHLDNAIEVASALEAAGAENTDLLVAKADLRRTILTTDYDDLALASQYQDPRNPKHAASLLWSEFDGHHNNLMNDCYGNRTRTKNWGPFQMNTQRQRPVSLDPAERERCSMESELVQMAQSGPEELYYRKMGPLLEQQQAAQAGSQNAPLVSSGDRAAAEMFGSRPQGNYNSQVLQSFEQRTRYNPLFDPQNNYRFDQST